MATEQTVNYNGWTNRETWAAHLHLTNTEWLLGEAREYARADGWGDTLAGWVRDMFADVIDGSGDYAVQDVRLMVGDVGSLWRVNWKEIRDALLED